MKRTILIDGHNLLFRYFQGMPQTVFSTDGRLLHGAYGMIGAVLRLTQQFTPTALLVCFDSPVPSDRVKDLPSYKANRPAFLPDDPNNPFTQLDVIREALDALAIPWIEQPGIEADDLIGSYAQAAGDQEVIILSTDRDYLQLVSKTTMLLVRRGKTEKQTISISGYYHIQRNKCRKSKKVKTMMKMVRETAYDCRCSTLMALLHRYYREEEE